jgi:putative transposase
VGQLREAYAMSARRACRLIGAHRRTMPYARQARADELRVRERLRALAVERPRWGYRRLHGLLRRERGPIHRKRVQRR